MPRLTGLDTLRLLRNIRCILPCIILSANLDERIVEQARREHAFSVLSKPVTLRPTHVCRARCAPRDLQLARVVIDQGDSNAS